MNLAEYLKGTKSPMVLISHDILQDQVELIQKYENLVLSKDIELEKLRKHIALLEAQKGGLNMVISGQDRELKQYKAIPTINIRG